MCRSQEDEIRILAIFNILLGKDSSLAKSVKIISIRSFYPKHIFTIHKVYHITRN